MKLPKEDSKWTARFRYLEVGHYVSSLKSVIREKRGGQPLLVGTEDVEQYRTKNSNIGIYTSVFQYDDTDLTKASRLGNLYFDLDSPSGEEAFGDARTLVSDLLEYITPTGLRIYFTGQKGFHIECEAIACGISPANDLSGHFRFIASSLVEALRLTTLDFSVYDSRRMWRLPGSIHQLSGLYKRSITSDELFSLSLDEIKELAKEPGPQDVPDQEFEAKANEWYREWGYIKENKNNLSVEEQIERFQKYGTSLLYRDDPDSEWVFTPDQLEHCPAINRLWTQAEEQHDLPHEARLFLCSLLSYSPAAERFLHSILSLCSDYNPEKSQAHINDWKRRRELGIGGRPYTCERANSAGVGCGDCDLESKSNVTGEELRPSPIRYCYIRKRIDKA